MRASSGLLRSQRVDRVLGEGDRATMAPIEEALRESDLRPPILRDLTALLGVPLERARRALSLQRGEGQRWPRGD